MKIAKFQTHNELSVEYELTITHKEIGKLLDLNILRKLSSSPKDIYEIKKQLSEKLKCPIKDLKYDSESERWIILFEYFNCYEISLFDLIRKAIKTKNIEKRIKIILYPTNLDALEQIISRAYRILLMDYDNNQGFYITKFSSSRYTNFIASIVDGPLLSIIRFSSENKAEITERKNFHVDEIYIRKYQSPNEEQDLSFWINNYIKSKHKPADMHKFTNDEFQRNIFNVNQIVLSLISSLRGLISKNQYLLPWPFSSFELTTNSHKLYTVFPIAMKIKDIKKNYDFDIHNIFDDEIKAINYDEDLNLAKITVSTSIHNIDKENIKPNKKNLELITITTNDLVNALDLEKNKKFIGIVMGQTFKPVSNYPFFLIHAYKEEESKLINLMNMLNTKISIDKLKHPFYCNNIIEIKELIYSIAYNTGENHLGKLKGNDKLLCTTGEIIETYMNIIENAIGESLQPTYIFNTNI